MLSRQRYGEQTCILDIIDSDDANVLWYLPIQFKKGLHQRGRGVVVCADKGVRLLCAQDGTNEIFITRISVRHHILISRCAVCEKGFSIAGNPQIHCPR